MENTINNTLQQAKLDSLKQSFIGGVFAQKDRFKKEAELKMLIQNALFLEKDEERKKRWISIIKDISLEQILEFIQVILRENLRYKKHERDIVVELNKRTPAMGFA